MANEDNLTPGNKGHDFASKQPTPEQKINGWKRKRLLKDIAEQIVSGESREIALKLAEFVGVEVDQIDVETLMHLRQMEKAIKEKDTAAYNAVLDRLRGKATQPIKAEGGFTINFKK